MVFTLQAIPQFVTCSAKYNLPSSVSDHGGLAKTGCTPLLHG